MPTERDIEIAHKSDSDEPYAYRSRVAAAAPSPAFGLNAMRDEAYATSRSKGWYEQGRRDIPTLLCLIHSEVSEALEAWRETGDYGIPDEEDKVKAHYIAAQLESDVPPQKPEGVAAELADVIIRIGDLCGAYGIDLDAAVAAKMSFNKTRPHRHGGKKV